MQITDDILIDLNKFKNNLMLKIEEFPTKLNDIIKLLGELSKKYKELSLEITSIKINEESIINIVQEISCICFLINQKMRGK